jgi:hypothetical protein
MSSCGKSLLHASDARVRFSATAVMVHIIARWAEISPEDLWFFLFDLFGGIVVVQKW